MIWIIYSCRDQNISLSLLSKLTAENPSIRIGQSEAACKIDWDSDKSAIIVDVATIIDQLMEHVDDICVRSVWWTCRDTSSPRSALVAVVCARYANAWWPVHVRWNFSNINWTTSTSDSLRNYKSITQSIDNCWIIISDLRTIWELYREQHLEAAKGELDSIV